MQQTGTLVASSQQVTGLRCLPLPDSPTQLCDPGLLATRKSTDSSCTHNYTASSAEYWVMPAFLPDIEHSA